MTQAFPPRIGSFVPRPIHSVKSYGYVVELGDTAMGITEKFGLPASRYRELVAANLYDRLLAPMALGSPFACRTLGDLQENEVLRIPSHWPDAVGAVGTLGDPQLDAITAAMGVAMNSVIAAGGGPTNLPPGAESAALNTAVQWWYNTVGTAPASNPVQYVPYVTTALDWAKTYLPVAMGGGIGQGATLPQLSAFPWGPFLAALPAIPADLTKVDWANGSIPGANGAPWSSIPWGWLATLGTNLEGLKIPPIAWPANPTPETVFEAWKAAILAAMWSVGEQCGQNSAINAEHQCACLPGYEWVTDDPNNYDCKPVAVTPPPPAPPVGNQCPPGALYDPNGIAGPGCYSCEGGYNLATHACNPPLDMTAPPKCPPGTTPDTVDGKTWSCKATGDGKTAVTAAPSSGLSTAAIATAMFGTMALGAVAIYAVTRADKKGGH